MALTLEELEARLKANPFAREFYELASAYQKLGRLDEAKKLCERGLEKYPGNFQARLLLTQILIAEGKFKEARQNVDRVLMVVPDNVTANYLAGDVSFSLGDHSAALRYYKVVELFEPGRSDVVEKIAAIENAAAPAADASGTGSATLEQPPAPQAPAVVPGGISEQPQAEEVIEMPVIPSEEPLAAEHEEEPSVPREEDAEEESVGEMLSGEAMVEPSDSGAEENLSPSEEQPAEEEIGSDTLDSLLSETASGEETGVAEDEPPPTPPEQETVAAVPDMSDAPSPGENAELAGDEEKEERSGVRGESGGLNTMTIAELYEQQGYPEKAVEVYQHILLKEPEKKDIRMKIERLKDQMMGLEPEGGEVLGRDVKSALRRKRIEVLGTWLRKIKEEGNV